MSLLKRPEETKPKRGATPSAPKQNPFGEGSTPSSQKSTSTFGLWNSIASAGKNLARSVAKPFVTAAVTAAAPIEATARLAMGDQAGADKRLTEGYNVPGFGQVKPVGADIGQEGGTAKELGRMLGTGAEIAATIGGGAAVGNVAKEGAKGAAKEAVKMGVKQGAATGAAGGFGTGVQEEDASIIGTLVSTAGGAALGAAAGAAGGAIAPKLTKAGRAAQATQKAEQEALDVISPKTTARVAQEALEEGRVVEKGIGPFKKEIIDASKRDKEMAQAVGKFVKAKARPNQNIQSLRKEIGRISESEIRPYLKANDAIFNENIINSRLKKIETPDLFKADPVMDRTYNLVRQRAMDVIKKNKKNMTGLLDARQEFDRLVDKEFPRLYDSERDTVIKRAITDMRNEMNDFIADSLPEGAAKFKGKLRQQSLMYEAIENIAEKGRGEVGTTKLQRFGKRHPRLKQAAQIGGSVAVGAQGYDLLTGN